MLHMPMNVPLLSETGSASEYESGLTSVLTAVLAATADVVC